MASQVDWDSLVNSEGNRSNRKGGGSNKFMKFEDGQSYTVRPVGQARQFYKFYHEGKSVVVSTEDVEKASALLSEHFGQEIKPQLRYVINVFDREDGSIKIMEQGHTVFKQLAVWAKAMNVSPGGSNAADWLIQAEGEKLRRKYTVTPLKTTPLSDDERRRAKSEEFHDLDKNYEACPVSEIIKRMTEDRSENESSQKSSRQSNNAQTKQTMSAGSTINDDPTMW